MTAPAEHPYASFVHLVQKPARYLGGEFGARPKDWEAVEARVCLAFPDVYDIGMSHLGFKILYKHPERRPAHPRRARLRAVGRHGGAAPRARPAARVAARARGPLSRLRRRRLLAPVRAHVHERPRRCSTSAASRCAPTTRGEDDPLVIAGGPTATHPEPLAPFLDAVVIGDGEERTTEVALVWAALKRAGRPARRAAPRARRARRRLRAVALRDARRRRTPASRSSTTPRDPRRAVPGASHARRRPERLPVPRRRPHRRPRGHLRSHVDRDRARLHRGLPLLPGGDDLPPRARARPASRSSTRSCSAVEEERLRRGEPHVALDRRLLVHRAAREEGRRRARAEAGLARRLVAPRVRARRERARRHRARPRDGRHLRARGGHASGCATSSTRTSPKSSSSDRRAHLLARLDSDEALLHDRPADRGGGGRPRDPAGRRARARDRQARQEGARRARHARR